MDEHARRLVVSGREEVLRRVRQALADRPGPAPVDRGYGSAGSSALDGGALLRLFEDRLLDYRAVVHHSSAEGVGEVVASCLAVRGVRRLVVPDGLPQGWLAGSGAERVGDRPPLSARALDALDGVLTTCTLAIAETGTIVLDGSAGQGRRALSLVPDYHLVVVRSDQVVAGVPDAIARLRPTRPATWISGPSATSDIELVRVEGVHGPRSLEVVLVS